MHKNGLVLQGGGAKGAYQYGCLLAFSHAGIRFDAVAGTSVGALNAALWSADSLAEGGQVWRDLSPLQVIRPKKWGPLRYLILLALALREFHRRKRRKNFTWTLRQVVLFLSMFWIPAGVFIALQTLDHTGIVDSRNPLDWEFTMLVVGVALAVTALAIPYSFLPHVIQRVNWSAFDPTPLADAIHSVLGGRRLSIPTYCTLSRRASLFDPDRPGEIIGVHDSGGVRFAAPYEHFLPKYHRVPENSCALQRDLLLGSAALPFGLMPAIRLGSRDWLDGGLSDNEPVTPIAIREGCSVVVVVRCSPLQRRRRKRIRQSVTSRHMQKFREINRLLRIESDGVERSMSRRGELSTWKTFEEFSPPKLVPYRDPERWPKLVLELSPDRRWGFGSLATLDFRRSKARRLMVMGLRDGRKFLRAHRAVLQEGRTQFEMGDTECH